MPRKTAGKTRAGFYFNPVWRQWIRGIIVVLLLMLSAIVVMLVRKPGLAPGDRFGPMATLHRPDDSDRPVPAFPGAEEMSEHRGTAPPMESRSPQTAELIDPPGQLSDIPVPIGSKEDAGHAPQHDTPDQHAADIPDDAPEPGAPYRVINQDTVLSMETDASTSPSPDMIQARPLDDFPLLDPAAGLTLQAISWSTDPARRLAVINGRICREGEPVDGYVLVRINPDNVLLSDGRTSGRLIFKIR